LAAEGDLAWTQLRSGPQQALRPGNQASDRHFNLLSASSFAFGDLPNDGILTITSIDL
jgi:hypothetical protein